MSVAEVEKKPDQLGSQCHITVWSEEGGRELTSYTVNCPMITKQLFDVLMHEFRLLNHAYERVNATYHIAINGQEITHPHKADKTDPKILGTLLIPAE